MTRLIVITVAAALAVVAIVLLAPRSAFACEMVVASWYGAESGNRTASGERFDGSSLTAAHRTLPFGTRLRVSYRGRSVVVRINDRGGFHKYGRSIDLSRVAAERLGMIQVGVASVCLEVLR